MKRKNKIKPLSSLFRNNKFILIFSLVFAIIIWLSIALSVSPEITLKIEDIPIAIDMENSTPSKLSLEYFPSSDDDLTVDITVTGKRYAIGGLNEDSIKVTAVTSAVDSTGYHNLKLKMDTDVELSSFELSKDSVNVFFDTRSETEFTVQSEIIANKIIPSDEYIQEKEIISPATIKVSGATQEIEKIEKIVASVKLTNTISENWTSDAQLLLKEKENNAKINREFITLSAGNDDNPVKVTIPVSKKRELPVSVKFTNVPEYYLNNPLKITASPKNAKVAAQESEINKMATAYVGTVDFSKLSNKVNQFTFTSENFIDTKAIDPNVSYTVKIDASMMDSKTMSVQSKNVEFQNLADSLTAFISDNGINDITVIGPSNTLEQLNSNGLYAEIDMKNISSAGRYSVPARIYAKSVSDCWVYGTYNVNVIVK